jgi:hypothetical protein
MAERPNISEIEQWASMIGGAVLTLYGLSRLRRHGWIFATFGVLLFRRGLTRHCHTYDVLGMSTAWMDAQDWNTGHDGDQVC